jgi:aromatase
MPELSGTFVVKAPLALAFELTNSPEAWPETNPLIKSTEVLEREGHKTVFRVHHADGRIWKTALFAIPEAWVSYAERLEPVSPLACMQYVRTYRDIGDGRVEVTERVRFELTPDSNVDPQSAIARMRAHMVEVQPHIQKHIEARALALSASGIENEPCRHSS